MSGNSLEAGRTVTHKVSSILLSFGRGGELSLTEIARITGIPMSTAHRLTAELASQQLLERKPDGMWGPGLSLQDIGAMNIFPPSLAERAPCILEDLGEITKCRVRLGVWQDVDVSYIEKRSDAPVTSFTNRAILPAHPTAIGRALLAFSSSHHLEQSIVNGIRPYTGHTLTSPARLRHALAVIRQTRVAVVRGEFEADICSVAMPVFGVGGQLIAAIEVGSTDLDDDLQRIMSPLLIATRSLSRELAGGVAAAPERATAPFGPRVGHLEASFPAQLTPETTPLRRRSAHAECPKRVASNSRVEGSNHYFDDEPGCSAEVG